MFKLASTTYNTRHYNEIKRYFDEGANILHIVNENNEYTFDSKIETKYINIEDDIQNVLNQDKKYDLIIVTDIFELSSDIYYFLDKINCSINHNGKLLITSINTKWNLFLYLFEMLNLKNKSIPRSYIHPKKINTIAKSAGFELIKSYSRQIFPFKFFKVGNFLNKALEVLFNIFDIGINNYMLFSKTTNEYQKLSKTVIIPAKNEEKNLPILFSRMPDLGTDVEFIIVCGKSEDLTLENALDIKKDNSNLKINVIEQVSKGKAGAVYEAIENSDGALLAILDSDLSVDPETLPTFFSIVEEGRADFVNGTRLIYKMEDGAMRRINNIGNIFFQFFISYIINQKLTDSLCGTKVFKRNLVSKIYEWQDILKSKDPFGDFDLIFSSAYFGNKILEYPVHYRSRTYGETQISRFRDGFKLIVYLIESTVKLNTSKN
ncbi:glycosyltransferase family 2 protein [Acidimicrobiaceae bacterium]|nr:glycosyltransferase family 2 protein [Acidimicrobiaceae bacterium]